jgi:hypothetical protein
LQGYQRSYVLWRCYHPTSSDNSLLLLKTVSFTSTLYYKSVFDGDATNIGLIRTISVFIAVHTTTVNPQPHLAWPTLLCSSQDPLIHVNSVAHVTKAIYSASMNFIYTYVDVVG